MSRMGKILDGRMANQAFVVVVLLFLTNGIVLAQAAPGNRTFQTSKSEIEKALRKLPAYPGGRLPILDGFVIPGDDPLERYQQGYYQYSVQMVETSDVETSVQVSAKVTAWYVDDDPKRSGYRSLPSNGRLEADLLDRLQDVLEGKTISPQAAGGSGETNVAAPAKSSAAPNALPDAASRVRANSVLQSPESLASAMAAKLQSVPPERTPEDPRIQQLQKEAKNLEEILHNQSRPNNLASVKDVKTPVYSRPAASAKVLFVAEAQDEFQVLETQGDWVHVQISGPSRGWIRRSQLDLSSVTVEIGASEAAEGISGAGPFQQTHNETATFPGTWEPLRGKTVRILWVKINEGRKESGAEARTIFAKSLFRKTYPTLTNQSDKVEGVVIVFDSADGGMVATTLPALQGWSQGSMTDDSFWQQCWFDPPEAFGRSAAR